MTFQIADLTALFVVVVIAATLVALILAGLVTRSAADFLRGNRRVRLARHERLLPYYGHLVLGH